MSKKEVAIRVKDIHKEFLLPQHKNSSIKQTFVNIVRKNNKTVQKVLDGVSFDINHGDFFGIVGRNGSGKSTLLKILAGVYTPTSGGVEINGKLTPFIELGVGFNPELSGRDNVFLNGALLGFTHEEMESMYDEIIAFAELEPFMDQKLKNYSSGMQVRLAFSVAIKARNEIMIFDEVLAVGDEAFQRKCLDVFEEYKRSGQTVVLVTHDMETVKKYCNKAILIHDGKITKQGSAIQVADEYSHLNQKRIDSEQLSNDPVQKSQGRIVAKVSDKDDKRRASFKTGETARVFVEWPLGLDGDSLMVDVFSKTGSHISGFKTRRDGIDLEGESICFDLRLMLAPGKYSFTISLRDKDDNNILSAYDVAEFSILKNWDEIGFAWSGFVHLDHEWR